MIAYKNKIPIKIISLILAQVFLITGIVHPEPNNNKSISGLYIQGKELRVPLNDYNRMTNVIKKIAPAVVISDKTELYNIKSGKAIILEVEWKDIRPASTLDEYYLVIHNFEDMSKIDFGMTLGIKYKDNGKQQIEFFEVREIRTSDDKRGKGIAKTVLNFIAEEAKKNKAILSALPTRSEELIHLMFEFTSETEVYRPIKFDENNKVTELGWVRQSEEAYKNEVPPYYWNAIRGIPKPIGPERIEGSRSQADTQGGTVGVYWLAKWILDTAGQDDIKTIIAHAVETFEKDNERLPKGQKIPLDNLLEAITGLAGEGNAEEIKLILKEVKNQRVFQMVEDMKSKYWDAALGMAGELKEEVTNEIVNGLPPEAKAYRIQIGQKIFIYVINDNMHYFMPDITQSTALTESISSDAPELFEVVDKFIGMFIEEFHLPDKIRQDLIKVYNEDGLFGLADLMRKIVYTNTLEEHKKESAVHFSSLSRNHHLTNEGEKPTTDRFAIGPVEFDVTDENLKEKLEQHTGELTVITYQGFNFTILGPPSKKALAEYLDDHQNLLQEAISRSESLHDGQLAQNITIILADNYDYLAGDHRKNNLIILNASDLEDMLNDTSIDEQAKSIYISELIISILSEELSNERGAGNDDNKEKELAQECARNTMGSLLKHGISLSEYIEFLEKYMQDPEGGKGFLSYLEQEIAFLFSNGDIRVPKDLSLKYITRFSKDIERLQQKGIVTSTKMAISDIQKALRVYAPELELVLIGSYAEGRQQPGSDIDIGFTFSTIKDKDIPEISKKIREFLESKVYYAKVSFPFINTLRGEYTNFDQDNLPNLYRDEYGPHPQERVLFITAATVRAVNPQTGETIDEAKYKSVSSGIFNAYSEFKDVKQTPMTLREKGHLTEKLNLITESLQAVETYVKNIRDNAYYANDADVRHWLFSYGDGITYYIDNLIPLLYRLRETISETKFLEHHIVTALIAKIGFNINQLLRYSKLMPDESLMADSKVKDVDYEKIDIDKAIPLEKDILVNEDAKVKLESLGWNGRIISGYEKEPIYQILDRIIDKIRLDKENKFLILMQDNGTLLLIKREDYKGVQYPVLKRAVNPEEGLVIFREKVMAKLKEHRERKINRPVFVTIDGQRGVGKSSIADIIREGSFGLDKNEILVIERVMDHSDYAPFSEEFSSLYPNVKLFVCEGFNSTFFGEILTKADVSLLIIADRPTRRNNLIARDGLAGFKLDKELSLKIFETPKEDLLLDEKWVDIVIDNSEKHRLSKEKMSHLLQQLNKGELDKNIFTNI